MFYVHLKEDTEQKILNTEVIDKSICAYIF